MFKKKLDRRVRALTSTKFKCNLGISIFESNSKLLDFIIFLNLENIERF